MIGIAFDLGRPAFVAFDEQARGDAAERHRRRKKQRPAGDFLFRLTDVGNDQFVGLDRAGGADAGERQRRAHQLEERPAADRIDPLGRVLWKLAMEVVLELGRVGELLRDSANTACPRSRARARGSRSDQVSPPSP